MNSFQCPDIGEEVGYLLLGKIVYQSLWHSGASLDLLQGLYFRIADEERIAIEQQRHL